jgi:hypothetical protein
VPASAKDLHAAGQVIPRMNWRPIVVSTVCGLFMWAAITYVVVLAIDTIAGPS